jgi:phenylalanine-4-hydroxylase
VREESMLSDPEDLWAAADEAVNAQFVGANPRFTDPDYRVRRNVLASLSHAWRPGDPISTIDYSDAEHGVWADICRELSSRHERFACHEFLEAKDSLGLPTTRIPQLTEVSEWLKPLTGFHCLPVPGLVPARQFYGGYRQGRFYSTQFIRHYTMLLYTPEPDIVHELIGHGNHLASPAFADIYRLVGQAVERTQSDEALRFMSQVFWSTLELGVVQEKGEVKAYGAALEGYAEPQLLLAMG